ncbi:hypothetical protein [Bradyrhizobium liaoningense]|uniref:hypothetical protein n=1 Tax=Bradyrhizobium liaoningense TaxID=43992 RepID=UPI000550497D|nr:hypothetical protein [Bradyrhizobium liaoningense]
MDSHLVRYGALVLLGILFYAVLARGLFNVTENWRRRALEIAEDLHATGQLSDGRQRSLYRRLGEVHSALHAWKLVWRLVVVCVFYLPFSNRRTVNLADGVPLQLRADYQRFNIYWVIATLGNSPAATLLFAMISLVMLAFVASLSAISDLLDRTGPNGGKEITRAHS